MPTFVYGCNPKMMRIEIFNISFASISVEQAFPKLFFVGVFEIITCRLTCALIKLYNREKDRK